jgi:hypothetical protein
MAITFGASAPSQITTNYDALFSTSLANYSKKMVDNISSANALFYEMKKRGLISTIPGSTYIAEDLMYELGQFDAYDGYDELGDTPTDGITQVQFQWRQGAIPITYSMKEMKQNKTRIIDLVKTKIKQAEMGFIEGFNKSILQGALSQSAANSVLNPFTSSFNGAYFIDPLPRMICYDPTASLEIGNINQSTYSWWRNNTDESAATSYTTFLAEMDTMYNNCSKGPGGEPKLIITDQTTYELLNSAYYYKYRTTASETGNYPFANIKFRNATVVWDQYMPDVFSNSGSGIANCNTYGTMYFVNPEFISLKVEESTNFTMTEFQKPPKGDSRLAHILFMGQMTINNRRKHGVIGKIARTLTAA